MSRGISDEMKQLLDHQKEIKNWTANVNSKIVSLEALYLDDTPLGNIIRGWEHLDGKPLQQKIKGQEDKDKLFSHSAYSVWMDAKNKQESNNDLVGEKRNHSIAISSNQKITDGMKSKKMRKSSQYNKKDDDYDYAEDEF